MKAPSTLLVNLTTVFAWMPVMVLSALAIFGAFSGLMNIMSLSPTWVLTLCCAALCGIGGSLALSAICWHFPLTRSQRIAGLLMGIVGLVAALVMGAMSGQAMLQPGLNWVSGYFYYVPLVLMCSHLYRLLRHN